MKSTYGGDPAGARAVCLPNEGRSFWRGEDGKISLVYDHEDAQAQSEDAGEPSPTPTMTRPRPQHRRRGPLAEPRRRAVKAHHFLCAFTDRCRELLYRRVVHAGRPGVSASEHHDM